MRCYFIRGRQVVGVGMLPTGLSDQDAIAMAHKLSAKRKGPIDGFEVWDGARLVLKYSAPSPRMGRSEGLKLELTRFGGPPLLPQFLSDAV